MNDVTEILLKVALNAITLPYPSIIAAYIFLSYLFIVSFYQMFITF